MSTSILVMITIVVVKIARVLPRTEHTFWLHQLVCGVMHHMKNWGPLPDTSAYWLERQQKFLKGQVHSQKDPEMTLFKHWSEVANDEADQGGVDSIARPDAPSLNEILAAPDVLAAQYPSASRAVPQCSKFLSDKSLKL
eukprot:g15626.t1